MKILLIYPPFLEARLHEEEISAPPLGLYYVGALLKEKDYHVEILNWAHMGNASDFIAQILKEKKPDIIGFSILQANRWGGLEIAKTAKAINPNVTVVFGGIGATFLWKHFLSHFNEVDFCVLGEGEYPFLKLIRAIKKRNPKSFKSIKGIAFRTQGRPMKTGRPHPIKNLDDLPIPSKFFNYQHVAFTRGCPGNCTFCGSPRFWGRRVRFHSAEYFVKQLEYLYQQGTKFFYFSDDTFLINKTLVIDICRKIIERDLKISWFAISRVDLVSKEVLYWMRLAGCTQISYGVESGSEKIRHFLNKNIQSEQIKKAFRLTTRYGILARAYFIYGSPGENRHSIQETIDLIHEIKPLSAIFYILDIFPGTTLYDMYLKQSSLTDDIWLQKIEDILYFETDPHLTEEMILNFGKKLRTTFHEALSDFTRDIELTEKEAFRELNADFLSRLAMTFSHGDYTKIEHIPNKKETAKNLYGRSLDYAPNDRAYLGLGMIKQQEKAFRKSITLLDEGIRLFPLNDQLKLCQGINHMNLGEFQSALDCFEGIRNSNQAEPYIKECWKVLETMGK
ncbi:MAG: B12-binding domain-containing radical SAM protein [Deltaproteobacteria bacterium]|nr:B12-binding domain-containing radical SAM protein [Deltaproteobacteria bacterium]